MNHKSRIYVAGHAGLVGSALIRRLATEGYQNLITRTHDELDLTNQQAVENFFTAERPEYVFASAARVGGIHANNTRRGEFIRDNLLIQTLLIDAAHRHGAQKFLFLGSSCIYPRESPQPIHERFLLSGALEHTNEPYAVAKIAGLKMVEAYRDQYGFNGISLMPTNLYGPGDQFDLNNSHVLPALIRKFHEARVAAADSVTVWGTGSPLREFMHVDDLASACLFLMRTYSGGEIVNVGTGQEISIAQLARLIADVVDYRGTVLQDASKPDGTPRKLLDVTRLLSLGWRPQIGLREGIERTYAWYRGTLASAAAS